MSKSQGSTTERVAESATRTAFGVAARGGICVADGVGLSIRVERSHLVVVDGIGRHRREQRFHRATHGLSRIVVLGSSGTLSLDALRYCDRLGIAVVVVDPMAPRVLFSSSPKGTEDARIVRVQAMAAVGEVGLDLTRRLLRAKLLGQADNLRRVFAETGPASSIEDLAEAIPEIASFDELRHLEAIAAAGYFHVWAGSPLTVPRFAARDRGKVPAHWLRFDGRTSVLKGSHQNRKAERPVNALLNYLFALLEAETVLACVRVGIDPSLGILHSDQAGRRSMALDLMEPVRPSVETWALDLLEKRTFTRADFFETSDGHVRLLAPLTHELAGSMSQWQKLVSPWVEEALHLFGDVIKGRFTPSTPLTKSRSKSSQRAVRARKAQESLNRSFAGLESHPRQRVNDARVTLGTCEECGGPLRRGQHVRCPSCWEGQPGQDIQTRKKRGRAISESKREARLWREEHPQERRDPEEFRQSILPGLQGVPLSRIMEVCGVAKSTASAIRSGKRVPVDTNWEALRELR